MEKCLRHNLIQEKFQKLSSQNVLYKMIMAKEICFIEVNFGLEVLQLTEQYNGV
jgi:hypothetical protein